VHRTILAAPVLLVNNHPDPIGDELEQLQLMLGEMFG
jgi:hypothetical protein